MNTKRKRIRSFSFNKEHFTQYSIGALFHNHNKLAPEHPDAMGELDIPKVLLDDLVNQFQTTGKSKISIAAWNNLSKEGEQYVTLTGKLPKPIANPYPQKEAPDEFNPRTETLFS